MMVLDDKKIDIINRLKKYDICSVSNILINLLNNKEITYREYVLISDRLKIKRENNLLEGIIKTNKSLRFRKKLTMNDINSMNFVEVRYYFETKMKEGLNINDLEKELLILWDDGIINGFTYRFIIETLECELDDNFIKKAKLYGRYYF